MKYGSVPVKSIKKLLTERIHYWRTNHQGETLPVWNQAYASKGSALWQFSLMANCNQKCLNLVLKSMLCLPRMASKGLLVAEDFCTEAAPETPLGRELPKVMAKGLALRWLQCCWRRGGEKSLAREKWWVTAAPFLYLSEGRQAWDQGWRLASAEPLGNYSIKVKALILRNMFKPKWGLQARDSCH